ncbi:MAG: putative ABC transporter permease [Clostridia bacterium]|nr:putative ABC transporter permease [Clostridia bacterium]
MNELVLYRYIKKRKINIIDSIYIFILASFLGWLIEIGYVYSFTGKFVDRGMTYSPLCTIYGIGALLLYIIVGIPKRNKYEIIYVFISSSLVLGCFELLSGLFLRYIFNMEMWNYNGQFLEVLNYTTLPIAMGWGVFACIYLFLIQPILLKIIHILPQNFSKKLALLLIAIYFVDYCTSMYSIGNNPDILYKLVHP